MCNERGAAPRARSEEIDEAWSLMKAKSKQLHHEKIALQRAHYILSIFKW